MYYVCTIKSQFFYMSEFHWRLRIIYSTKRLYSFIRSTKISKPCGTNRGILNYGGSTRCTLKIYCKTAHTSLHLLRRFGCLNFCVYSIVKQNYYVIIEISALLLQYFYVFEILYYL